MNITLEGIKFLKDKIQSWPEEMCLTSTDVADLLAIIDDYAERLESPGPTDADNKTLMRLAQDLGVPFSAAKIIYDKAWREAEAIGVVVAERGEEEK